jgi:hypothetical protein
MKMRRYRASGRPPATSTKAVPSSVVAIGRLQASGRTPARSRRYPQPGRRPWSDTRNAPGPWDAQPRWPGSRAPMLNWVPNGSVISAIRP